MKLDLGQKFTFFFLFLGLIVKKVQLTWNAGCFERLVVIIARSNSLWFHTETLKGFKTDFISSNVIIQSEQEEEK